MFQKPEPILFALKLDLNQVSPRPISFVQKVLIYVRSLQGVCVLETNKTNITEHIKKTEIGGKVGIHTSPLPLYFASSQAPQVFVQSDRPRPGRSLIRPKSISA